MLSRPPKLNGHPHPVRLPGKGGAAWVDESQHNSRASIPVRFLKPTRRPPPNASPAPRPRRAAFMPLQRTKFHRLPQTHDALDERTLKRPKRRAPTPTLPCHIKHLCHPDPHKLRPQRRMDRSCRKPRRQPNPRQALPKQDPSTTTPPSACSACSAVIPIPSPGSHRSVPSLSPKHVHPRIPQRERILLNSLQPPRSNLTLRTKAISMRPENAIHKLPTAIA